jgi:3-methyl-2-oxobutanoate hydroxymethyltransferase
VSAVARHRRLFYELQRKIMSGYLQGKDMAAPGSDQGAQAPAPVQAPAPAKAVPMAVTVPSLRAMRAAGQKIAMLTCYDASFASLMDRCGV